MARRHISYDLPNKATLQAMTYRHWYARTSPVHLFFTTSSGDIFISASHARPREVTELHHPSPLKTPLLVLYNGVGGTDALTPRNIVFPEIHQNLVAATDSVSNTMPMILPAPVDV